MHLVKQTHKLHRVLQSRVKLKFKMLSLLTNGHKFLLICEKNKDLSIMFNLSVLHASFFFFFLFVLILVLRATSLLVLSTIKTLLLLLLDDRHAVYCRNLSFFSPRKPVRKLKGVVQIL